MAMAAMALSGCTDTGAVSAPETNQAEKKQDSDSDAEANSANQESEKKSVASFKDAVTYKDGLKVEVTGIAHGKISDLASGGKPGGDMTTFTLRITNGSKAPFDATLSVPSVTYGDAGETAEGVFDDKAGAGFAGKVLPGKSMSAPWAFAIPKAELADVTLQLELGALDKEPAIFTGSAQ
ncbi:hypothetical protein [Flindersiella endophytica]